MLKIKINNKNYFIIAPNFGAAMKQARAMFGNEAIVQSIVWGQK